MEITLALFNTSIPHYSDTDVASFSPSVHWLEKVTRTEWQVKSMLAYPEGEAPFDSIPLWKDGLAVEVLGELISTPRNPDQNHIHGCNIKVWVELLITAKIPQGLRHSNEFSRAIDTASSPVLASLACPWYHDLRLTQDWPAKDMREMDEQITEEGCKYL